MSDMPRAATARAITRRRSRGPAAGREVSFATVIAGANARGDGALGYKSALPVGVVVNPAKSCSFDVRHGDRVIVLADR